MMESLSPIVDVSNKLENSLKKEKIDPDKKAEVSYTENNRNKFEAKKYDPDEKAEISGEKKGGSYGELKAEGHGWNHEPPEEIHHMPSVESSPLDRNDGPAIVMDYEDHRQTASCGNSAEAREYRKKQKELIDEGKFDEAVQMDIDDIHEKFGDKYDDAIDEMREYVKELKEENRV